MGAMRTRGNGRGSRSRWIALAKLAVSVGILVLLFRRVDAAALRGALGGVRPPVVVLAVLLYAGGQLVSARKWALLAGAFGFHRPYAAYARLYFAGMFVNLLGPSTIGGDVIRTLGLGRPDRRALAAYTVLADRGLGLTVLVGIGLAALAAFPEYGLPHGLGRLTGVLAALLVGSWWIAPRVARLLPRGTRLRRMIESDLAPLWRERAVLIGAAALSLVFHLMETTVEWILARALGLAVPFSYCLVLHPAVSVLAAVPVSIAGLGIREGGYAFFLEHIGVPPAAALTFGLLWFGVVVLGALPGGLLLWRMSSVDATDDAASGARRSATEADP